MLPERRDDRWAAHPLLAASVRAGVVLVPLALSVVTGVLVGRALPLGNTTFERIGWWLLVFVLSSAVLFVSDRLARRVLPLAVLLELSLVFPDRAPSRIRSVRTASVRDLDSKLARLRAHGLTTEPMRAAETLVVLVGLLGLHDKRTRGHSERVRALVDALTNEMGLSEEDRSRVRWAALVHDLGKLTVPTQILNKSGSLDDDEWDTIRRHPDEGVRLVAGLLPWLGDWGRAIGEHHERWDGMGYPAGLSGEEIGLGARIVSVADSYEVMTSARSYSRARSASAARKELTACAGAQFDPQVVRCFLSISLGRLRWIVGPLTWLAEIPFLAVDRGGQAVRLAAATLGVGGLAVAGVVAPPAAVGAAPATRPPVAQTTDLSADQLLPTAATPAPPPVLGTAGRRGTTAAATAPTPSARPTPSATPRRTTTSSRSVRRTTTKPAAAKPTATKPVAAAASKAPSTYWFARGRSGYVLSAGAPSRRGAAPDYDQDGRPGRTLRQTDAGLDASDNHERLVLTLPVRRTLRLDGAATVVLSSRLVSNRGNARVLVRLQDCTAGGACTTLGDGHEVDGNWSRGSAFSLHEITIGGLDATVAKGHRLRLTLVVTDAASKSDLLVGLGSRSTPSRIVLPVS